MAKNDRVVLIDADLIVYAVGFAATKDPLPNALHSVKVMLNGIIEKCDATDFKIFLTGEGNYRNDIATIQKYKGNRKAEKPVHYQAIRDYMVAHWDAEVIDGCEADDAMACAQSAAPEGTTIIATLDKDLDTCPGLHYNWRKNKVYWVSQKEADLFFMEQLITGDTADNIRGIPGHGPKKAQRMIEEADSMADLYWSILELYELHYVRPYEALVETSKLLWIQRKADVLFDTDWVENATTTKQEEVQAHFNNVFNNAYYNL